MLPASLVPAQGAYFGARVAERDGEGSPDAIQRLEAQVGRRVDIDHQYYQWGARIPTSHQRWDVENGRIPFINWKAGGRWSSIANGDHDDWIRDRADAFVEFGAPIYVTFHHEPENDLSWYGSPPEFAAAFRRTVDVFRSRGATNVAFVWTMMGWTFDPRSGRDPYAYYPGDAYVDVLGADGYNWYPGKPGSTWGSFHDSFVDANSFAVAHSKPWMVVEYGCQEDPAIPGRKGAWFREALATAKTWPALKALIYFDVHKTEEYDWTTDSSSSSLDAYREIVNDPWLMQQGQMPVPSPTPSPEPPPPPSGQAPAVVKNGLNAGPQGAAIVASGGRGRVRGFDAVSTTLGATLTYDRTHARGPYSAKHVLNEGSDSYYEWRGRRTRWFGRVFVWLDANPGGDLRLIRAREAGTVGVSVNIRYTGQVGVQDAQNEWVAQTQRFVPLGRWIRVEWKVDHGSGRVQVRVFASARARTPTEVIRAGPRLNIGSGVDQVQFGRSGSNQFPFTFWTDSPALFSKGFVGRGGRR